eukprot:scaffold87671_cov51-Prasinocladus_malaysianus.AAC.2
MGGSDYHMIAPKRLTLWPDDLQELISWMDGQLHNSVSILWLYANNEAHSLSALATSIIGVLRKKMPHFAVKHVDCIL